MSSSLNDVYSSVDKLEANSSNWFMFQLRFLVAARYKKILGQFDGSNPKPVLPIGDKDKQPSADERKEHETSLESWMNKEGTACQLLWSSLLNSVLAKVNRKANVADMWDWIVAEYTKKSMAMQSHLHAEFMAMRYKKGADLRTEFNQVHMKYEELLNAQVTISDNEYRTLIFNFLPAELSSWLSGLSMQQKLAQKKKRRLAKKDVSVDEINEEDLYEPDELIEAAIDEWLRHETDKLNRGKPSILGESSQTPTAETGMALAIVSSTC